MRAIFHAVITNDDGLLESTLTEYAEELHWEMLKNFQNTTPLHCAAQRGNVTNCKLLLDMIGEDGLNLKDNMDRTPVMVYNDIK